MARPLAARATRAPRPFDAALGREALLRLPALDGAVAEIVRGAAGSSPHLAQLLLREGDWIAVALDDPEGALEAALAEAGAAEGRALGPALRQAKRRVGLLTALMDLGGGWSLGEATGALTRLADLAVDRSLRLLVAEVAGRGRLPVRPEAEAGGMVALAMGKMGAFELNYSSDIDLVLLFDEAAVREDDFAAARAGFVRVARALCALLQDRTAEGYVFRVDLRLRPDAAVTPVCLGMAAAESYYESLGRTWERAAYIKARPCGGDRAAGDRFLDALRPFVWRRHLDFAAIRDAHDIRLRIRDHRGLHGPLALDGHDLKLGRGGIREIEFFAQTRQLIAGGRDPSLRVRGTLEALRRLSAAGWVPEGVTQTLSAHYARLREMEHRVQMIADAQTHQLPAAPEGWARLAALAGEEEGALRRDLRARLEEVDALTEGFFAPGPAAPAAAEDDWGAEVTARWPRYAALRSQRAVEIFGRLRPEILRRLREAARPEEALASFDGFLAGLPAGVQLFALFEANPDLLRLIAEIAATSPALARYLSRNAGVLDAVIGGGFWEPWPGREALETALGRVVGEAADYEAALVAARRWSKEWWFRVGVHHLQGLIDAEEAGRLYADLAGAVLGRILPLVAADFARRHGGGPGWAAVALGMGSLGAERLNAASDLDLILIYDAPGEASDGPRPLPPRTYFARLTQALVTALSAQMAEGRLYAVDMRLRPSGRQGPVATSWTAFRDYQRHEAWTWEHLALTRARVVAGTGEWEELGMAVEAFRQDLIAGRRGDRRVLPDVAAMRARLAAHGGAEGAWDAKVGPGRLRDVDLFAQGLALRAGSAERSTAGQVRAGVEAGLLPPAEAERLLASERLLWRVQAAARLLTPDALDPDRIGEGGRRFLLRETGAESLGDLADRLAEATAAADRVIGGVLAEAAA
ncbi:glutamine-synthetase adenylyltransferase [Rubellimicrobium sp. CFH 75288]|uniref:[protein-PII] uridylyltransferase family protein n=1 Tax=Rubellimicrobium sp. CFH 75288 TaxID=2697034 RepID=UPI00141206E9|nr:glutamine-synthetase adenylyltransferase [Rubellimicrobium sp. CFH 75288]NAZ35418.1 glutamine-synthetase adenylyltransferase [Rubellimicrobium sp. CFH 75288]